MAKPSSDLILRAKIQSFVRHFGLLRNKAPCGKPISISEAHALMCLKNEFENKPCSQGSLQKVLTLNKSNIARLCSCLEKDGFVVQDQAEHDQRIRHVTLTPKGERMADSLLAASQLRFNEILKHIPKNQHLQVFHSLDLLTAAVDMTNRKIHQKKVK